MKALRCYKGLGYNTFFLRGAISTYISAIMPLISEQLSLSYTQVGNIFAGNSIGILLGSLLIGSLVDHIGTKIPLLIAFLSFPVGVILFGLAQTAPLFILANVLIGFSSAAMEVGVMPISKNFKNGRGKLLNLIHAFFALGSMISPLAASFLIARDLPYMAFLFIIAGYSCIPLYFSSRLSIHIQPVHRAKHQEQKGNISALFKNKFFWIIVAAQFFYVASEGGVFYWAPLYSSDYLKNSEQLSSLLPSIFWVGLLIGRLLSSRFVDKIGHLKWLILITSIGVPVTFLAQLPPSPFWILAILLTLSGLIHASVTPTLQSLLIESIHNGLGVALSIFSIAGSFGYMAASFVVGQISSTVGIKWGYFFPFLFFSGVFVLIMLFVGFKKREKQN